MPAAKGQERPMIIDGMQYNKPNRERFLEWQAGGVGCVHVTIAIWEDARTTLSAIGEWNRLFEANADLVELAKNGADIDRIYASGRTAVIYGFQDTSPIEDDLELVEIFHTLGVRIIQLTYNVQNRVAAGCWEDDDRGVSKFFGVNVIREMNKLGMVIDLSHCNEQTCLDAVEHSSRPVTITHGNPAEFVGQEIELKRRNRSLATIKRITEAGGMIGLSFYPKIMRDGSNCTLETFTEMVAWSAERLGVDAIAIGTDYYTGWPQTKVEWFRTGRWSRESAIPLKSLSPWPTWFQNPSDFPNILEGLSQRGFSDEDVAKIVGGNWLKFFREGFSPEGAHKAGSS